MGILQKEIFEGGVMNKEKEMIERNIELSAEFSRYLFEHPEVETKIPIDAEIVLLPEFDKELKKFNLQLGKNIEADGGRFQSLHH